MLLTLFVYFLLHSIMNLCIILYCKRLVAIQKVVGDMKYLSEIRRKNGFTQAVLAEKVGVSVNSIARYERGEVIPSTNIAHQIATVLNCTEAELFNGFATTDWNLRLITTKEETEMAVSTLDLTGKTARASLEMSDTGMGLTISGSYELWADNDKFEDLILQLRKKRAAGLKLRKEDW